MSELMSRLVSKCVRSADGGCWQWTGSLDRDGYGRLGHEGQWRLAHRVMFAAHGVELGPDLEVDHLCRNRACVNPDHLEVVTRAENNRRKWAAWTHCSNGHELTGDNVRDGFERGARRRTCRACVREATRRYRNRKKASA